MSSCLRPSIMFPVTPAAQITFLVGIFSPVFRVAMFPSYDVSKVSVLTMTPKSLRYLFEASFETSLILFNVLLLPSSKIILNLEKSIL